MAEAVQRSLAGSAGLWPAMLPRLRAQARMKRADLVRELAARLGAESKQDKVAALLPPDGAGAAAGRRGVGHGARGAGTDRGRGERSRCERRVAMPAPGPPRMDDAAVFARTAQAAPRTSRPGRRLRRSLLPPTSGTRSTAFSAAAERQAAVAARDSSLMHQLIKLYLSALRSGDRPLSASLARVLRSRAGWWTRPSTRSSDCPVPGCDGPQPPSEPCAESSSVWPELRTIVDDG